MRELLEKLSNVPGPSGFEEKVVEEMRKEIGIEEITKDLEINTDALGNLIIKKKGKGNKPTVLLDAHMDECGFMVKYIDDDGFIYFDVLGGFFDQTLLNQKVIFSSGCKGVIGSKAPHIMEEEEFKKIIKARDMYIDIGVSSKEEAESLIKVGDFAVFENQFEIFNDKFAVGRNLDNRIGCAIIIKALLETKTDATIYIVGSMEEETGLIGIRPATYGINPDIAIAVDTTIAGDQPNIEERRVSTKCGEGPVLVLKDGFFMPDRELIEKLEKSARFADVKVQKEVSGSGGTTNGSMIRIQKEGISTAVMSVATRYIHTPVSMASLDDIEDTVKVLVAFLDSL